MFDIYKRDLHENFDAMLSAVIHKNDLFEPASEDNSEYPPLTEEEKSQAKKVAELMRTMACVPLHKAIRAA